MSVRQPALKWFSSLSGWRLALLQVLATALLVISLLEGWSWLSPPKDKVVWPVEQDAAVGSRFRANAHVLWTNGLDFRVEERTNEAISSPMH